MRPLEGGLISSVMLVCGVLASLALGVMIAYWICLGMFAVLKMRALKVAAARVPPGVAVGLETAGN